MEQLCSKCGQPLEKWKVLTSWRGWTCQKCKTKNQREYEKIKRAKKKSATQEAQIAP